jgi:glycosyltransferase involved in cell wall biosynthesis
VVVANSVFTLPLVERMGLASLPVLVYVHESSVMQANLEASHPGLLRRLPTCYIAVSEAVACALRDEQGVLRKSISVIPPFVDIPHDAVERSRHLPFVVGGMGNPSWTKGVELWLLVAREVVKRLGRDRVRFRGVGIRDNEEGRQFRAMVQKLDLTLDVDLVAETSTPVDELAGFDVLAVTSWEEAASLVVLEAMAAGTPVVCFQQAGGPAEEIAGAGIAVGKISPGEMAQAIACLLSDDRVRASLGEAGRARVREAYGAESVIGAIERQLMDLTCPAARKRS